MLMEQMAKSISLVTMRKDSRRIIAVSTLLLLFFLLVIKSAKGGEYSTSSGIIILSILGSLLAGINLSLAYTYADLRRGTLWSVFHWNIPSILSFMKTVGRAYGTAAFSILLGFFGFSAMFSIMPGKSEEVGYIGLIILLIAMYALAHRIERTAV